MSYVTAFWVGGLICALCQILLEKTKLMPGRVMVILVCSGALLGAFNIYQPFVEFAGAGASVPLLGFGNVLWKGVKEAVDENGFLGIFMGETWFRQIRFYRIQDDPFRYLLRSHKNLMISNTPQIPLPVQVFRFALYRHRCAL